DENTWWLGVEYNSEVELDAEFPSGTSYTISVSGGTLGALDQVVNLPGKDYPSNAPHFTKFTEMGSVDATSDFEVTSNSVGNTTQSWLEVIPDIDIYEDPPLSAFTIPADTFSGASNNTATLAFVKSLEVDTGGFGSSDGHAGHALLVQAPLNTAGSGNPPGVTFWKFIKGIGRTQTADNTAPAASSWAIDINVETEYASDATSVTISGGGIVGSRMFKYDDEDAEWYFETDFDSEVDLDAEFPSATTYTITLSGGTLGTLVQDVALPAKAYPNVPYLTGTDFTDIQSLDPAADFIANFNPPGSLTQNSGRTVFEVFAGYDADDVFRVEAQGATDSGTIPGTTLASSTGYYGYLEYTHSANIDGNGGFGVDGTVSHNLATDFRIGTPMSPLVGAWQFGDGASDDSGVLVFLPNGVYFHGEDTIADGSDVDGMERGTYTWNDSTGALTATPIVDTNGEIGLSHPIGSFVFTVNEDVLTAGDSEGSQPLNRVTSQSDPLVGAWQFGDGAADSSGVGVILDNGIYFLMDDVESGGADEDGLERGGFIWNSGTGVFTATPVVDTNGEGGLSHPIGGFLFVVTGDVLTVTDDEESTVLNRVGAPNSILPAWIWDYDLERTISETIEKGDAPVTVLDVQGLISLSASGLNISILLGLEDAVNLRMLDLSSNRIRDLGPLSGLVGLEKLDLSSNEISDLSPIAGLTNLIFLDISDNLLEDPAPASEPQGDVIRVFSESQPNAGDSVLDALSAMSKLKALLLGNNKIRNLEILEELILLTEIDLSNNLVTDLTPLAALVLLEEINLSNNLVVDLTPLVNLAELSEVTLFGNLIDTTEGSAQRELLEQIAENSGAIIVLIDSGPGLRVSFDSVSNQFELIWSGSGVLQSSGNLNNWVDIDSAESPYAIPSLSGPDVATFWRLRKSE
ncbi:MAG: leucine-rich repeat domain-containing protein, partial [Verrucomicrobiia bacterium]